MKKTLFKAVLCLSTFFTLTINAQLENTIWYMGSANGVTFTLPNYAPIANTHNSLGLEGTGVATNPITGVLMFYTDGIHLYNANNVSMPNEPSGGLGGCPSAAQSVVFCKVPGTCLKFYVFVNGTGFGCPTNDLSVYIVDMTLNGGLGDILPLSSWDTPPASNVLYTQASESMTLIPISGTDEFWLVGKTNTQAQMYAYKIDANFQTNFTNLPITSPVAISASSSWNMEYSSARPINQNVAIAYPNNASGMIYTLGFNTGTGVFSSPVLLVNNINGQAYDVEWSASGDYLYYTAYSNFQQVNRWDFNTGTPQNLFLSSSAGIQGGGLKTGPDGLIYFLNNRTGGTLASISDPDGANPVYNGTAFSLATGLSWQSISLPYTFAPGQITETVAHAICPGETLTLNETGGVIYSWYNQDGVASTTSQLVVTPTASTSYTVAIVSATGCITYKKHDISVSASNGDPITVNASASTICVGDPVTITASGATTYTIAPAVEVPYDGSVTFNPNQTNTYTITGYTGGCIATQDVVVTVSDCRCESGGALGTEIGLNGFLNSTFTNAVLIINQDVLLTAPVAFNNCEVKLAPGVTITVPSGLNLKITNSRLYACYSMWEGIVVQGGGSINIESAGTLKSSLIEDAKTAVNYAGTLATETLNPIINISNTTFNRNQTAIVISNFKPNAANYNITLENNLFTCRDIPVQQNSWPFINSPYFINQVKAAYDPNLASSLDDQYINETIYSSTNTNAFLKAPFAGTKASYGIRLSNVGLTNNEFTTTPNYRDVKIGRWVSNDLSKFNLFDNLAVGIGATRANVNMERNIFQNSVITLVPSSLATIKGRGIHVTTNKAAKNNVTLNRNEFINCHHGAELVNYFDVYVSNCTFRSTQDESQNYVGEHIGKYALQIQTNQYRTIQVLINKLFNVENGIVFNSLFGPYQNGALLNTNAQYSGQVSILNNTIRADYSGYTLTTQYVRNAIIANNVFGATGTLTNTANSTLLIENNSLNDVNKGIEVANWKKNSSIHLNTCTLKQSTLANFEHSGILFNNNLNTTTTKNLITENSITGFGTTNTNTYGIKYGISTNSKVYCNVTTNTFHGLSFSGASFGTVSKRNKLSFHRYGFVLDGTGTSIGQQGGDDVNNNRPADNEFLGNWTGSFMTATMNGGSSIGNQMWVHNSVPYNPNFSSTFITPASTVGYSTSNGTILYSTLLSSQIQNCPNVTLFANNPDKVLDEQEHIRKHLNGEIPYELFPLETGYNLRKQIFQLLDSDPNLTDGNALLTDFVTSNQASNHGKLKSIEHHLSQGNLTNAQNELGTLESNDIDGNFRLLDEIFLTYATDTLNETDSLNLIVLGNMCPLLDGSMVYQARAMYGAIYGYDYQFSDGCPQSGGEGNKSMMQQQTQIQNQPSELLIYPNPNSGKFIIKLQESSLASTIQISDMQGRIIAFKLKEIDAKLYEIEMDVENGIYNIQLISSNSIENVKVKVYN